MSIPGKDDAERVAWLGRHRLWLVADLLADRQQLSPAVAAVASRLAVSHRRAMQRQVQEERHVLAALCGAGLRVIVLKGAALAHTVYPQPESRYRTDLDLLAEAGEVANVETVLKALGYRRPPGIQSPKELRQRQWERRQLRQSFLIDLHWDLRNHPALEGRFLFPELLEDAAPLPGLDERALGMGREHALLNASMHYFNDYADERPAQALLDKDLLWRAMSEDERERCMNLACQRGLAGLLAESLVQSRELFATPVVDAQIEHLKAAGRDQWATRMVHANEKRRTAYWFALRSEPNLRRKLNRIRFGLFPSADYMRQIYPEGSRFGLLGLYFRRILTKFSDGSAV